MMAGKPRPIVLVAGACLGGWAWHEVAETLRAQGHEVYPTTLTGLGERAHLATRAVDLETHISDVLGVLDYEDLQDAVLIGHSYAGIVVTGVADRRPERLEAVVYLDTSPLPSGTAITDVQTPEQRERQRREAEEKGDGWLWPAPDRATLLSGAYGSAAGLDEEQLQLVEARATPHPYATFTSPLRLSEDSTVRTRRIAIFCSDGGMSLATLGGLLANRDPRAAGFAEKDWELHELPTGHWAMFSSPGPLAELVHQIASR